MKRSIALVAVTSMAFPAAAVQAPSVRAIAAGDRATRLLLAGDVPALTAMLSPTFLASVGGEPGVARLVGTIRDQLGAPGAVLDNAAFFEGGITSIYRRMVFAKAPDTTIHWLVDASGAIQGGAVRSTPTPAVSERLDYQTRAKLRLPFTKAREGQWYVAWGGRDAVRNYHVTAPDQRFALDLLVLSDSGSPYRTDGKTNADHYCFGTPVLAPADGRVVAAVDGIADNATPGVVNDAQPTGNHVVVDHGNGEFSFLAHFRQGSVAVRTGQTIAAGSELGRCGNSGRSTLPHIHYHLQDSAAFGGGKGIPAWFNGYRADGRAVARGEPVRGQRIEPLPATKGAGLHSPFVASRSPVLRKPS